MKRLGAVLLALIVLAGFALGIRRAIRLSVRPYDMPDGRPLFVTDEHRPYVFTRPDGLFHPDEPLRRGECCELLYGLLLTPVEGHCSFADVGEGSPYHEAVACLCAWGVVRNSCDDFRPEDAVTRAQLVTMLSAVYPAAEPEPERASFSDSAGHWAAAAIENAAARGWVSPGGRFGPDEPVTRGEFCCVMNAVLGRRCDEAALLLSDPDAGWPDVTPENPCFGDVMEASLAHDYSLSGAEERWSVPAAEPGLHALHGRLYYVQEDGTPLRGGDVGSLHFGADGRYTSGDPALDAQVTDFLCVCTREDMSRLDKLRAAYLGIEHEFSYGPPPPSLPEVVYGDVGFEPSWAAEFFRTHCGNCIGYASAFCMAARALGYEARAVFGLFNTYRVDHCWVLIPEDGTDYIYDPEQEIAREWLRDLDLFRVKNGEPLTYYYEEFYG